MHGERKDELSGKQRRYLRGLGNRLKPVIYIGQQGITEKVIGALEMAFKTQELVKIKIQQGAEIDRHAAAEELARAVKAHLVQVLGRTVLLYRRHPDQPKIELPGE